MNAVQPPLSELFGRYLERQTSAQAEGLGFAEGGEEVVPHDAVPVQPVEPRLAWSEALDVLRLFGLEGEAKAPAEWPALVAAHESEVALPLCLGNYPQLVRHLPAVMRALDGAGRETAGRPLGSESLLDGARAAARDPQPLPTLLAAGVLRLARHYDQAADLLRSVRDAIPAAWQNLLANEEAALLWHRGEGEAALALWLAQPESIPVLFNRGMASLFLGRPRDARASLTRAAAGLPDDGAWHHLGRLYLALAEARG